MRSEFVFEQRDPNSVQQATLCFLIDGDLVLLAMKKRGFAVGLWNGVGGKVNAGEETIEEAAKRETREEIESEILELEKVAVLHFYFVSDTKVVNGNQDVHVFIVKKWKGEPVETEEMKPKWFEKDNLPYKNMWVDDPYWLPDVLKGKKLEGWFMLGKDNSLVAYKLEELKNE